MTLEFSALCAALYWSAGAPYLFNMVLTIGVYTMYNRYIGKSGGVEIERQQEFLQPESIHSDEAVKALNSEEREAFF